MSWRLHHILAIFSIVWLSTAIWLTWERRAPQHVSPRLTHYLHELGAWEWADRIEEISVWAITRAQIDSWAAWGSEMLPDSEVSMVAQKTLGFENNVASQLRRSKPVLRAEEPAGGRPKNNL